MHPNKLTPQLRRGFLNEAKCTEPFGMALTKFSKSAPHTYPQQDQRLSAFHARKKFYRSEALHPAGREGVTHPGTHHQINKRFSNGLKCTKPFGMALTKLSKSAPQTYPQQDQRLCAYHAHKKFYRSEALHQTGRVGVTHPGRHTRLTNVSQMEQSAQSLLEWR